MINKNRYRNVCDLHREKQMALTKIASVRGKEIEQIDPGYAGCEFVPPRQLARLKPLAFGLLLALFIERRPSAARSTWSPNSV